MYLYLNKKYGYVKTYLKDEELENALEKFKNELQDKELFIKRIKNVIYG